MHSQHRRDRAWRSDTEWKARWRTRGTRQRRFRPDEVGRETAHRGTPLPAAGRVRRREKQRAAPQTGVVIAKPKWRALERTIATCNNRTWPTRWHALATAGRQHHRRTPAHQAIARRSPIAQAPAPGPTKARAATSTWPRGQASCHNDGRAYGAKGNLSNVAGCAAC